MEAPKTALPCKGKAEAEVKPQLEDTSAQWKNNIHSYKNELSAAKEVHEPDADSGRVVQPELRAEPDGDRHDIKGSSEVLRI